MPTKDSDRDEIDVLLSDLPELAPDPLVRERIRRRARQMFLRRAGANDSRWLAIASSWYGHLEPALSLGVGFVLLRWALQTAAALYQ